jgi:hypothetical protein
LKGHGFSRACLSNAQSKFAARSQQYLHACVPSRPRTGCASFPHDGEIKAGLLQFADVALQRIFLHRCQRAMLRAYPLPESA